MRTQFIVTLFVSIAFVFGCSRQNDLHLAPVSGVILYEGQPLPNAIVCFLPEGIDNRAASVQTDANGRFILTTINKADGIASGKYQVTVSKFEEMEIAENNKIKKSNRLPKDNKNLKPLIPIRYNLPATSGLFVDVPAKGVKNLKLELTSK